MMEAWTEQSGSCALITVPAQKPGRRFRQFASWCVFWIGTALIGVVAIPAGLLFGLIYLIVRITDLLTDWLEKD